MTFPNGPYKRFVPTRADRTVSFVQVDPAGATIRCMLGDGHPEISGDGGWSFVPRPRRKSITEWEGYDGFTLTLPVMFDRFRDDGTVEYEVERLRRMMRNPQGARVEPAVVKVETEAISLPDIRWVIQSMDPTVTERRGDGARSRAGFVVTLYEYESPDLLVVASKPTPAAAAQTRAPVTAARPATVRTYTVRSGDTLSAIAARLLGSSAKWTVIADLNGIRDPKALRIGQVLRLP